MTDETTTEQLAEIEEQATGYTPPEGWRVLAVGEVLREGDVWVNQEGEFIWPTKRVGGTVNDERYIRPIEPEPQPQPVQVREGRWRTRRGDIKNIRPCEPLQRAHFVWPWTDGIMTFQDNGRHQGSQESAHDLVEYLGPIEEQPEPVPQPNAATIDELRSEVSYVQRLLGESRQRVAQLEELVASLRTINEAQEKAVEAAGKENSALRNQLAAVKAELATVAADRQRLQIELDAAQQVPADSPELRQLRADLEQMTLDRDTYRHAHELLVNDVNATHKRTKVMTVEAIVEWLVPIRTCGSQALATAVISNLPHIMRSLTGLADEDIE